MMINYLDGAGLTQEFKLYSFKCEKKGWREREREKRGRRDVKKKVCEFQAFRGTVGTIMKFFQLFVRWVYRTSVGCLSGRATNEKVFWREEYTNFIGDLSGLNWKKKKRKINLQPAGVPKNRWWERVLSRARLIIASELIKPEKHANAVVFTLAWSSRYGFPLPMRDKTRIARKSDIRLQIGHKNV